MLEITIFDANGDIVQCETVLADTASPQELTDMVALIEAGYPAYLAAQIAKN